MCEDFVRTQTKYTIFTDFLNNLNPKPDIVKPVRLTQSAQNPLVMVARIYNKLPEELKNEGNEKSFVRRLKKILKDNASMNSCDMTLTDVRYRVA
jgi:hypothetical protein